MSFVLKVKGAIKKVGKGRRQGCSYYYSAHMLVFWRYSVHSGGSHVALEKEKHFAFAH